MLPYHTNATLSSPKYYLIHTLPCCPQVLYTVTPYHNRNTAADRLHLLHSNIPVKINNHCEKKFCKWKSAKKKSDGKPHKFKTIAGNKSSHGMPMLLSHPYATISSPRSILPSQTDAAILMVPSWQCHPDNAILAVTSVPPRCCHSDAANLHYHPDAANLWCNPDSAVLRWHLDAAVHMLPPCTVVLKLLCWWCCPEAAVLILPSCATRHKQNITEWQYYKIFKQTIFTDEFTVILCKPFLIKLLILGGHTIHDIAAPPLWVFQFQSSNFKLSRHCRLNAAVSMLLSWRCHLGTAILTLPSWCCRLDAAVSMLPSRCCSLDAALLMLTSWCCHLDAVISTLPSRRCCLDAAILTLASRRYHPNTIILILQSKRRCCNKHSPSDWKWHNFVHQTYSILLSKN